MHYRVIFKPAILLASILTGTVPAAEPGLGQIHEPSFEDVLSIARAHGPKIAPDGSAVIYTVRKTNWRNDRFDSEIYLARRRAKPLALTHTQDGSSSDPKWSPDSRRIAFLADRGSGRQVYIISTEGGEAVPITAVEAGVLAFEWSPDGLTMAILMRDRELRAISERVARYGRYRVRDAEYRMTHLWLLDVEKAKATNGGAKRSAGEYLPIQGELKESQGKLDGAAGPPLKRLTGGSGFNITGFLKIFSFSPDGKKIAFSHGRNPSLRWVIETDISIVDVDSGQISSVVTRGGHDGSPIFSPDGREIIFTTVNSDLRITTNIVMARTPVSGGEIEQLTAEFDEMAIPIAWTDQGIHFLGQQRTKQHVWTVDPETLEITKLTSRPSIVSAADFTADGREFAVSGSSSSTIEEIYRLSADDQEPRAITNMTAAVAGWPRHLSEVIRWRASDGVEIEGILYKPSNFIEGKRYPLLAIIHGGPIGTDWPRRLDADNFAYPIEQWLAKGALILMANYRGSTGYGEAFRSLNLRNLGIGDSQDILSGIDYLIEMGIADPDRLGAMGWSHGGYVSAFLATTSKRFKAFSVGAGISDWAVYYANSDAWFGMRSYFGATPWQDPEIYAVTSPLHYLRQAATPTLIQHGELDYRVPIVMANALYRGLRDIGIESKLVIYEGAGHTLESPRQRLASMDENWRWFLKHVWGEEAGQ